MPPEEQTEQLSENNYQLTKVILIKETFNRAAKIPFGQGSIETSVDFSFKNSQPDNDKKFSIENNIKITGKLSNEESKTEVFQFEVTFLGRFLISGNPDLSFNDFCNINGPAIIFPFVREHIASISYKAGMPQLILPTLSFKKN
jgi:preprotein translocase subunit SecB